MASKIATCLLLTLSPFISTRVAANVLDKRDVAISSSLPTNWTYSGCYVDDGNNRSLIGPGYTDNSNMTQESCIKFCHGQGFINAGVEYFQECYCGNNITSTLAPSAGDCSYGCTGNQSEVCGGSNRLNIFVSSKNATAGFTNPGPSGSLWASFGCYNEGSGGRALANVVNVPGGNSNMTVDNCIGSCQTAGYNLAGVEYADQCYCGNAFSNQASPVSDGIHGCDMLCSGNSTEFCGGPNHLNVYGFNNTTPNPLVTTTSSVRSSTSSTTSVSVPVSSGATASSAAPTTSTSTIPASAKPSSTASSSSTTMSSINFTTSTSSSSSSSVQTSSTSKPSSGVSSQQSTIATTTARSSSSSVASPAAASSTARAWNFLGCFTDSVGARTLGNPQYGSSSMMTPEFCQSTCLTSGFTLSGVEYTGECYCDDSLKNGGGPAPDGNIGCNMACNGNSSEICGGPNRLSLYAFGYGNTTNSLSTTTTSVASSTSAYSTGSIYAASKAVVSTISTSASSASASPITASPTSASSISASFISATSKAVVSAISTSTSSTSVTSTSTLAGKPTGWISDGCYIDGAHGRILQNQQNDNQNLTIESCISTCSGLNYTVVGVEYGVQCFCDDFIRNNASQTSASDCSMACGGSAKEQCGAGNRMNVYSLGNLTVYEPPSEETADLPGNWTYKGCLTDNAEARTFPYRIVNMVNNNTATNCLSLCSEYGYPAGGMEYSSECYCGDTFDITAANATFAPDSDCNTACSGDSSHICGGPSRISYYEWTGDPLYVWDYPSGNEAGLYEFLIGGLIVPLISTPGINGKVTFLEKFGTSPNPNSTGAYELDLSLVDNFSEAWRPMHVKTDVFCSAGLTLPDKAGRQINIGGWANSDTYGIRLYWPDGSPGNPGVNDWQENYDEVHLQNGRWYPSAMIMANGSILVVGGEEGSNGAPVPTLELLPSYGPVLYCDWLDRTDPYNLYPFLAVLPSGGIFVAYYNEARILDEHTLATQKALPNIPGAVNDFLGGRTYPFEGTSVLLPQHAPYTDPLEILICGGSIPGPEIALDNCVSIAPEVPNANWTIERMPSQRVISSMTALPDGTYLIVNGGQQGRAGFGLATNPNHNAVLYDPSKPVYSRFSVMANTTIDRLYHSEAVLLQDGRVLISGSDPEDTRFEQEYRLEVFLPPYLLSGNDPPVFSIQNNNTDWAYGESIKIAVTEGVTSGMRASLLGMASSTHGNSMGQRTIFPEIACGGGTCTVVAPPNSHVCPPGWFQLFLLDGKTGMPSVSTYVRIGGDPGALGDWPDFPDFLLPGV